MLLPGRNIASLTGLRGLAALAVVLHHADSQLGRAPYWRGQPMVDIFFTLSGFVMSYVYLSGSAVDWSRFFRARFARIYPLHIATALAMAAASVAVARLAHGPWPSDVNLRQALREVSLTMAMPIVGADDLWNFPAWTISVEWWTYFILMPVLVVGGPRLSNRQAMVIFVFCAVVLAIMLHLDLGKATREWPAFARSLVGFGGGWVAYRVAATTDFALSPRLADMLALIVVVCIYTTMPIIGHDAWYLLPVYPVLILALVTSPQAMVVRFLSWRPVEWLGEISFSLYLTHSIVLDVLKEVNKRVMPLTTTWQWIVWMVPGSLVLAALSYYLFEMPMRRVLAPAKRGAAVLRDRVVAVRG